MLVILSLMMDSICNCCVYGTLDLTSMINDSIVIDFIYPIRFLIKYIIQSIIKNLTSYDIIRLTS
jgi:hypothetical protein